MKQTIPKAVKIKVWNTFCGEKIYDKCFCCNHENISINNFQVGHIQAESKNGETKIYNLRPICQLCNTSMKTANMVDFMNKYGFELRKDFNCQNEFYNIFQKNKTIEKTDSKSKKTNLKKKPQNNKLSNNLENELKSDSDINYIEVFCSKYIQYTDEEDDYKYLNSMFTDFLVWSAKNKYKHTIKYKEYTEFFEKLKNVKFYYDDFNNIYITKVIYLYKKTKNDKSIDSVSKIDSQNNLVNNNIINEEIICNTVLCNESNNNDVSVDSYKTKVEDSRVNFLNIDLNDVPIVPQTYFNKNAKLNNEKKENVNMNDILSNNTLYKKIFKITYEYFY